MTPGPTASPFTPDAAAAARIARLEADVGRAFREALLEAIAGDSLGAAALSGPRLAELIGTFGLASPREAALLALPAAATLARPSISGYRVGAVGRAGDGGLVLGGNLEFPGASIHHTVHAEGFVTLRSRALRLPLAELAISQARPCAHCRQVLAEMAWAADLRLVDPLGHDLGLRELYPWPFTPGDLEREGAGAGSPSTAPEVSPRAAGHAPSGEIATALARAGARAHAPYSGEPAAIVLELLDGRLIEGAVLESVAFNPTIGPLQDALVARAAAAPPPSAAAIRHGWLAVVEGARVDHVHPTRDLLAAVAPGAALDVTYWS